MKELNHPGAARRAPVTSSSLKSKWPTRHLGDRRFILLARQRNTGMQTPLARSLARRLPPCARRRARGRTNAGLADVNGQIGAWKPLQLLFIRPSVLFPTPDIKALQISACSSSQPALHSPIYDLYNNTSAGVYDERPGTDEGRRHS